MTRKLTFLILALFALIAGPGWGQTTFYHETFGTVSANTDYSPDASNLTDVNSATFITTFTSWKFSKSTTYPCDITGSSASSHIFCGTTGKDLILTFGNLTAYSSATLSFNYKNEAAKGKLRTLTVKVSSDGGTTWSDNILTNNTTQDWTAVNYELSATNKGNFAVMFSTTAANPSRIDDIILVVNSDTPSTDPVINVESTEVNLAYDETEKIFSCTVSNPTEEGVLIFNLQEGIDWITNLFYITDGIYLNAETNDSYETRSAEITLSYEGADDVVVTVNQAGRPAPSITVNPTSIDLGTVNIGEEASASFTVSQANLTNDITLSAENGNLDVTSIIAGASDTGVTYTITPSATGAIEDVITISCDDLEEDIEINVSGNAIDPSVVETYEKITSAPANWEGEYLLVYENDNVADVWTGIDAQNCYVTAPINSNSIAKPQNAVSIIISAMQDGYSIKVNGGVNNGKYISGASGSNALNFGNEAVLNTLSYTEGSTMITSNTSVIRFNSAANNLRFRYFKSSSYSSQQPVQLYKKVNSSSVATPTFSLEAGTYTETQNVEISCATEGANIYYTTDGTDPTEDSYLYISAIEIDETTTIKAIAYLNGEASDIATAEYEIVELYTITVDPSVFGEVTTYPADRAAAGTEVTIIISSIEEHYHVKEIHVYDGYAQEINVDDNGKFIMPESLVGVSVIFEEDQQCNISYYCNGSFDEYETVYAGPIGELREPSGSIPEGFTFAGWSTSMASITAITGTYNVSEDTDLFAIFAKVEGGSGEATATLTNSDITGSSLTNTYGDFSITNTYGTWSGNGCKQGNHSGDGMYFLQLRNNSTVSYLKLPVFPGNITSIVCEQVCNTSKEQYTGEIYFRTEAVNNADAIVTATSNDALDNVTLNIPSGYNTGYIMVSAACRIYSFTVTYQSGVTKYYTRVFQDETAFEDITIEGPSIIPTGSTLNMDTYTLTSENHANLIIEDGAQLIQNSSNVKATVLKNITGYSDAASRDGYYLVANPTATVANDEYDALDGCTTFDLYTFNPAAALEWVNIGSTSQKVTFDRNVGYLYANAQDMALHFRGYLLPTNVTTDIDLVYYEGEEGDGREFPGFNLIGNPYTCDAYISGGYFHFYKMVEGELQLAATSVAIAPCEGFFVEATGTDLSISISTVAPEPASTLSLTVSQDRGNVIDRAIVNFDESNNLHKFMMNPAHTNLSIAKGGETFAAISTEAEGELPVNFKAEKNGTYTITVNTENVEANYLHLIDNLTGMDTDLLSTPSYTFDAKTSDYASRFKLVFGVKNDNEEMSQASSFAYINNGEIVISNEGRATLQVIDVLGRIISSEDINGEARISTNGLTAGLYIVNLNGMTQKIVVR